MNVELRHLRYFVAVAEELHFGRAAERLHMAQPPVSQAVRQLEAELGVELLERTSRRVALTPAGEALLEDARAVLSNFADALDAARRRGRGETGHLTVGTLSSTSVVVPPIARRFREREPGVGITLKHLTVGELGEALRAGEIDLAIAYDLPPAEDGVQWDRGFGEQRLAVLPLVAALPEDHPLGERESLSLGDLAGEPWVNIPRSLSPEHHDRLMAICRRHGFEPDVAAEGTTMRALLELVAAGVGVMVAPAQAEQLQPDGVVYVPVPGEAVGISILWREGDPSPTAQAFRALAASMPSEELFGPAPVAAG